MSDAELRVAAKAIDGLIARNEKLKAEVERLKQALDNVRDMADKNMAHGAEPDQPWMNIEIFAVADNALTEEGE